MTRHDDRPRTEATDPEGAPSDTTIAVDRLVTDGLKAPGDYQALVGVALDRLAALARDLVEAEEQVDHIVKKASVAALAQHTALARLAAEETGRGVFEHPRQGSRPAVRACGRCGIEPTFQAPGVDERTFLAALPQQALNAYEDRAHPPTRGCRCSTTCRRSCARPTTAARATGRRRRSTRTATGSMTSARPSTSPVLGVVGGRAGPDDIFEDGCSVARSKSGKDPFASREF